mgnify:CR=1 FL=1
MRVMLISYGPEIWALGKNDKKRIKAAEMEFLGRTAELLSRVRQRLEKIRKLLEIKQTVQQIKIQRRTEKEDIVYIRIL